MNGIRTGKNIHKKAWENSNNYSASTLIDYEVTYSKRSDDGDTFQKPTLKPMESQHS